jgi:hypothetical protein
MKNKRTIPLLATLALTAPLIMIAPAAATTTQALVIQHQLHGCHTWSLNEGPSRINQTVSIKQGGSITVTNDDLMPQKLIETAGAHVVYTRITMGAPMGAKKAFPPAMLARIGATSEITFAHPGTYRFTTQVGNDYMAPVKTIGPDNILHLTVHVA